MKLNLKFKTSKFYMGLETKETYRVIDILQKESMGISKTEFRTEGKYDEFHKFITELKETLLEFIVVPCSLEFRVHDDLYIELIIDDLYVENKVGRLSCKPDIVNVYSLSRDGKVALVEQREEPFIFTGGANPVILDLTDDELTIITHRFVSIANVKERLKVHISDRKCTATYGHNLEMYKDIEEEMADYFKSKVRTRAILDKIGSTCVTVLK